MAKKKVPTRNVCCPQCGGSLHIVWPAEITQPLEGVSTDQFSEPQLGSYSAEDVVPLARDAGGKDRIVCLHCNWSTDETPANLEKLPSPTEQKKESK